MSIPRGRLPAYHGGRHELGSAAILFGATGLPDVRYPDGTEIAPQITLRFALDLYAGVRPIRLYPGAPSPLAIPAGRTIDYVISRENTEGLFASRRGGATVGDTATVDSLVITRGYAFFRRVFQEVAREYPGVEAECAYVDAMSMSLIQAPWRRPGRTSSRPFRAASSRARPAATP